MSLEAASASRKAKLDLLRKRKADEEAGVAAPSRAIAPAGSDEDEDMGAAVKRSFRNFDPNSRQAKKHRQEVLDTIEKDVQGVQERIIKEDELKRKEELDLINIAPKKPNWDLKRDMNKRLQKLERRNKEAILILIRQRIGGQKEGSTLTAEMAASVAVDARLPADEDSDESDEEMDDA